MDGENVVIHDRLADSNDELPTLAVELASLPVDIIAVDRFTGLACRSGASQSIPIVGSAILCGSALWPACRGLAAMSRGSWTLEMNYGQKASRFWAT